jgi:dTDP-4-amino-4,6-dideoxygalactose transaminase
LIQDCAYAFDATWNGSNICNIGDITIYGTNISKSVTSIFGGMLSTRNEEFYHKAREWQKNHLIGKQKFRNLRRFLYAVTAKYALKPVFFNLTYILITKTKLLDRILNSYHKDDVISFPPDAFNELSRIEAATGLISIKNYDKNKKNRKELTRRYFELTKNIQNWNVIDFDEGSNPSHFPIAVSNKNHVISFFSERGVQIGEVIEYSIPYTSPYNRKITEQFPISLALSISVINLPLNWNAYKKIESILLKSAGNNYSDLC